jgi:acetyltransferase-like isoleucine patch superfamily enzyme
VTIKDAYSHPLADPNRKLAQPITIGGKVSIGAGSIIAAGSIASKSIASNCIAAGAPDESLS